MSSHPPRQHGLVDSSGTVVSRRNRSATERGSQPPPGHSLSAFRRRAALFPRSTAFESVGEQVVPGQRVAIDSGKNLPIGRMLPRTNVSVKKDGRVTYPLAQVISCTETQCKIRAEEGGNMEEKKVADLVNLDARFEPDEYFQAHGWTDSIQSKLAAAFVQNNLRRRLEELPLPPKTPIPTSIVAFYLFFLHGDRNRTILFEMAKTSLNDFSNQQEVVRLRNEAVKLVDETWQLTESGYALLLWWLLDLHKRYEHKITRLIPPDTNRATPAASTYAWVCCCQEALFRGSAWMPTVQTPYSYYQGLKAPNALVPYFLRNFNKSLKHLHVDGDWDEARSPTVSACPSGSRPYGGAIRYVPTAATNAGVPTGRCVVTLQARLDEMGAKSSNPWYVKLVGTVEEAQRRLTRFKEVQDQLYLTDYERFNWVNYYYELVLLKIEVYLKEMAGLCDVKGEDFSHLGDVEGGATGWAKRAATDTLSAVKTTAKVAGVLLYKLIVLILRSPVVGKMILTGIEYLKRELCMKFAVMNNKVTLSRTTDEGTTEHFDKTTGGWQTMALEEQEAEAEADQKAYKAVSSKEASMFFAVLSNLTGGDGGASAWGKFLETSSMYFDGAADKMLGAMQALPVLGPLMAKMGGLDNVKVLLIGAIAMCGDRAWNEMVLANKHVSQLLRLKNAMMSTGDGQCDFYTGAIVRNGTLLGAGGLTNSGFHLGVAWQKMLENVPYYALIALNDELYGRTWSPTGDEDDLNKQEKEKALWQATSVGGKRAWAIDNLLHTEQIENHRDTRQRLEKLAHGTKVAQQLRRFLEGQGGKKNKGKKNETALAPGSFDTVPAVPAWSKRQTTVDWTKWKPVKDYRVKPPGLKEFSMNSMGNYSTDMGYYIWDKRDEWVGDLVKNPALAQAAGKMWALLDSAKEAVSSAASSAKHTFDSVCGTKCKLGVGAAGVAVLIGVAGGPAAVAAAAAAAGKTTAAYMTANAALLAKTALTAKDAMDNLTEEDREKMAVVAGFSTYAAYTAHEAATKNSTHDGGARFTGLLVSLEDVLAVSSSRRSIWVAMMNKQMAAFAATTDTNTDFSELKRRELNLILESKGETQMSVDAHLGKALDLDVCIATLREYQAPA